MSMPTIPQPLPHWGRAPLLPRVAHVDVTGRRGRSAGPFRLPKRGLALVMDLAVYLVVFVAAALLPTKRDGRLAGVLRRLCAGIVDRLLP